MNRVGSVTLRDYVAVLKQQWWIILGCTAIFAGVAYAVSSSEDSTYRATARLVVHDLSQSYALTGSSNVQFLPIAQLAAQEAEAAVTPAAAAKAAQQLGERNADVLRNATSSSVDINTSTIRLESEAPTGAQAATRANAFADVAVSTAEERQRGQLDAARAALERQVSSARRDLRRKQPGADLRLAAAVQRLSQLDTVSSVVKPVELLQPASVPKSRVSPNPLRDTVLGGVLGFIVGLLLAFARAALDRRVRSSSEVTDALGMPLVGRISRKALGTAGLLSKPGTLRPEDTEALGVLRANVGFMAGDEPLRSLLVTSAVAGEGKSTVSCGLAGAVAAAGRRVLLIEGDLRRPTLARRLGITAGPGLGDYLAGQASSQDILQMVPLPEAGPDALLVCITAGQYRERPSDLLQGDRFRELLEQVTEVYDLVIVDGTPVLSVADAIEILPAVDGMLFCVRARKTKRDEVRAARTALERVPPRPSGVVITGLTKGDSEQYEYYSTDRGLSRRKRAATAA
jgi:capsular exopolysaccharide synthesis family protein